MGNEVNVGVLSAILRLKDEMSSQLATVNQNLGGFQQKVGEAAKSLMTAFAAKEVQEALSGVFEGIGKMVEDGSKIKDLADRMGVSAEAFQRLAFAAKQGGAPMDAVALAMKTLSTQLADGKLPKALTDMGLSFEDIKRATPEATLMAAFEAVRKIEDPMKQSAAAIALFGRSGQTLLPAIRDGFVEVANQAPVMKNATVDAADKIGDKWHEVQMKVNDAKANAFMPLLDLFNNLPKSAQGVVVAVSSLVPSLSSIMVAVLAAGGPAAAWGMIVSAGAALGTFLMTTLPGWLAAAAAFLGPQGLVALALIALAAIWYKWGDDITAATKKAYEGVKLWIADKWDAIKPSVSSALDAVAGFFHSTKDKVVTYAQQLYEGVKQWLVDKFNAVVGSIKGLIQDVGDKFKWLHEVVVGHSYVPDLINGIASEFGRLPTVMVQPTISATNAVSKGFDELFSKLESKLKSVLPKLFGGGSGDGGIFGSLINTGLGLLFGPAGPLVSLVSAGIEALGALAMKGLQAMWNGIKGLFASEESKDVNGPRDQFFAQFGGYDGLAKTLTEAFGKQGDPNSGGDADNLIKQLYAADTKAKFDAATAAIMNVINGGYAGGTGGASTPSPKGPFDPNIDIAADPNFVPQFATGTGGRFLDFGKGTLAMLHGRERVMKEGEGGGGISIALHFTGTVIGNSDEFRDSVTRGVLDGLERGGSNFTKFRTLAAQAVG